MRLGVSSLFAISRGMGYFIKRLGPHAGSFDVLEVIDEGGTRLSGARLRLLSDVAEAMGVKLSLHAPFVDVNVASLSPFMRRAALKHLSRSMERAAKLGCDVWVVHGGLCPHPRLRARAYELSLASLNKLAKRAADLGLRVGLENYPAVEVALFVEAEEVARALREGLHESVGLCLDLGHANTARQVREFLSLADDLVIHVHAHDNDGSRDLHLTPGDGTIDWAAALDRLRGASLSGALIVETLAEPWEGLSRIKGWLSR